MGEERTQLARVLRLAGLYLALVECIKPRDRSRSFCSTDSGDWALDWEDEFTGNALDENAWQIVTSHGGDKDIGLPVAGLNITACRSAVCRAQNVEVSGGKLRLLSDRDHADASRFYSAAVTTKDRKAWSAGERPFRLCISAQLPHNTRGVWPAHWMLPQNGLSDKCLDEGEMDITEMVSGDGKTYNTYHWMSSWPGTKCGNFDDFHKSVASSRIVENYDDRFHEYAVERSANHISYAIDGRIVGTFRAADHGFTLSSSAFFLILNTAIGGGWPGSPTGDTQMPVEHLIDSVRVVRPSASFYQVQEGQVQAGNGFKVTREIRTHEEHEEEEEVYVRTEATAVG